MEHVNTLHILAPSVSALLFLAAAPCSAKQCVIPWSLEIKRANGTLEHVLDAPPGWQYATANIDLATGDSLVLDMDPNNYCHPSDVVMSVRAGDPFEPNGPLLAELGGSWPYRFTFRLFGDIILDPALFTVTAPGYIRVFEVGSPAVETVVPDVPRDTAPAFAPVVQDGFLALGGNPAGTLMVLDATGRTVLRTTVPQNAPPVPVKAWAPGVFSVALRYEGGSLRRQVAVVQ